MKSLGGKIGAGCMDEGTVLVNKIDYLKWKSNTHLNNTKLVTT